jgi:tetratricopeptide (TPR) repeat protein
MTIHRNLAIKALHRLCIIEEKLELFSEAKISIERLLKEENKISAKCTSFAYYRLAKCYLGLGNVQEAIDSNQRSIEIKQSLDAQRGIVFSEKLFAQIFFYEKNYEMAENHARHAYEQAIRLGVEKEVVATGYTLCSVLIAFDENKYHSEISDIINKCLLLCEKQSLYYRAEEFCELCVNNKLFELAAKAKIASTNAKAGTSILVRHYYKTLQPAIIIQINREKVNDLFSQRKSLSSWLIPIICS